MMGLTELDTAIRYSLPLTIIVRAKRVIAARERCGPISRAVDQLGRELMFRHPGDHGERTGGSSSCLAWDPATATTPCSWRPSTTRMSGGPG